MSHAVPHKNNMWQGDEFSEGARKCVKRWETNKKIIGTNRCPNVQNLQQIRAVVHKAEEGGWEKSMEKIGSFFFLFYILFFICKKCIHRAKKKKRKRR